MKLFKKHKCPTQPHIWKVDVIIGENAHLMPIDKRKNYALILDTPLPAQHIEQIFKITQASGYKIKIIINGQNVELKNA